MTHLGIGLIQEESSFKVQALIFGHWNVLEHEVRVHHKFY